MWRRKKVAKWEDEEEDEEDLEDQQQQQDTDAQPPSSSSPSAAAASSSSSSASGEPSSASSASTVPKTTESKKAKARSKRKEAASTSRKRSRKPTTTTTTSSDTTTTTSSDNTGDGLPQMPASTAEQAAGASAATAIDVDSGGPTTAADQAVRVYGLDEAEQPGEAGGSTRKRARKDNPAIDLSSSSSSSSSSGAQEEDGYEEEEDEPLGADEGDDDGGAPLLFGKLGSSASIVPLEALEDGEIPEDFVPSSSDGKPIWVPEDRSKPYYGDASIVKLSERLSAELRDFVAYLSATPAEHALRLDLHVKLQQMVSIAWGCGDLHAFGSFPVNLYLPHSDMDFVVLGIPRHVRNPLRNIASHIRKRRMAKELRLIAHAKVPIIKMTEKRTDLELDISFDMENGVRNTSVVLQFLKVFPQAGPLCIAVKYLLKQHGLNEPYKGGLGSYALFLLIVSFLQMRHWAPQDPNLDKEDCEGESPNLGALFLGFLRYYGTLFNFTDVGISVLDGGSYFPKSTRAHDAKWVDPREPTKPAIEDPQDATNNVGSSAFAMYQVADLFARTYKTLVDTEANRASRGRKPKPSLLSRVMHVPKKLVQQRQEWEQIYHKHKLKMEERSTTTTLPTTYSSLTTIGSGGAYHGPTAHGRYRGGRFARANSGSYGGRKEARKAAREARMARRQRRDGGEQSPQSRGKGSRHRKKVTKPGKKARKAGKAGNNKGSRKGNKGGDTTTTTTSSSSPHPRRKGNNKGTTTPKDSRSGKDTTPKSGKGKRKGKGKGSPSPGKGKRNRKDHKSSSSSSSNTGGNTQGGAGTKKSSKKKAKFARSNAKNKKQ